MSVTIRSVVLCLALCGPAAAVESVDFQPVPRPGTEAPEPVVAAIEPEREVESDDAATDVSSLPAPRPDGIASGFELRYALQAAANGDWNEAYQIALKDGPVAADIIEWRRLRAGRGTFTDYQDFLARNGDWPGLKLLRKRGEARLGDASPDDVIAYFAPEQPQTGVGALALIEAHEAKGAFTVARAELVRIWQELEMSAEEEAAFLAKYEEALKPHHLARLDAALWREDRTSARRMLKFADEDRRALAEARMALQARSGSADRLWKAVPEKHAADGGLAKDRMRWLIAKRRRAEASDLIIAQSTSRERLGEPEAWAHWRRVLARQAMRDGSPRRAYQLASTHFLDGGSSYADLEWLSGYIALRYRKEPQQALTHFRHFRSEIFTPISLGRAGYWEGRALEEMGEEAAAREAYADAAKHQTSFYGLLAAEEIGVTMDPELTGNGGPRPWQDTAFAETSVFQAAQLYALAGQRHQYEVTRFLRHLAETTAEEELVALGDYTLELGNPYVSVRVAKQIAQRSVVAHRSYYPLSDLSGVELVVEEALALSIARRESEFYPQARSQAGALGLMQLMPGTARDMASKLRLPYSQGRLTSDPAYNVALGSAYLDQLIDEFGNNIVLVSVGYNAGPHRARSWMERFGDPRREGVDVVDWIEHIPFRETRNYVMRVAESLPVYRARRSGATAPLALSQELKAR